MTFELITLKKCISFIDKKHQSDQYKITEWIYMSALNMLMYNQAIHQNTPNMKYNKQDWEIRSQRALTDRK